MANRYAAEFDAAPWSEDDGRDFRISMTQKGQYANYSTSAFSYRGRPLSEAERAAIAKYGLPDLSSFIGPEPDAATRQLTWELYEDSRRGDPFDNAKYGSHFRSWESRSSGGSPPPDGASAPIPIGQRKARDERNAELIDKLRVKAVQVTEARAS